MTEQAIPKAVHKLIGSCAATANLPEEMVRDSIGDGPDNARAFVAIGADLDMLYRRRGFVPVEDEPGMMQRDDQAIFEWWREPQDGLDGDRPIDVLQQPNGLARLRQYVEWLSGR